MHFSFLRDRGEHRWRATGSLPTIYQITNHSKEAGERYIRDVVAVKFLVTKFDDVDVISHIIRLTPSVVKQYPE